MNHSNTKELINFLLCEQKKEIIGLTEIVIKYLDKEQIYNLFEDIIIQMPGWDFYNFLKFISIKKYNDLFYINYEMIISKITEYDKKELKDYYFSNVNCNKKELLNIIRCYMNYDICYIKNEILDSNLLKLTKGELDYLNNYMNSFTDLNNLILNYFVKDYSVTFPLETNMFIKSFDETYKIFLINIVKDLINETQINFSDIKKLGHGTFSNVYQFNDKILKFGIPRKFFCIPNSKYILQPLVRLELKNNMQESFATLEITQLVSTENISVSEAILLEKKMRREKLVLMDHTLGNCGHLLKKNVAYLNNEEFVPNAIFNGFDKNNKEVLDTSYKGSVIIDSDYIIRKQKH